MKIIYQKEVCLGQKYHLNSLLKLYIDAIYTCFKRTVHPGNFEKCSTLAFSWFVFLFKITEVHCSSLERSVMLDDLHII